MKINVIKSVAMMALFTFSSSLMAAIDSGRVTIRGQIVEGDEPCKIVHQNSDQAIELSNAKAIKFSLKVNQCAHETLENITATFTGPETEESLLALSDDAAVMLQHSNGKVIKMRNTPEPQLVLSKNNTLDFTATLKGSIDAAHSRSALSQLTLAYE
ncbi:fimbrial protein [Pantoea sp. NPDC088449]|uniref:fimbrial protein n=1 Tax=Pantoea sp. NPDC088449 TaxID=3364392 RepID=UPI00380BA155